MARFFLTRVLRPIAVLVAITIVGFIFMKAIPGDPVTTRLGDRATPGCILLFATVFVVVNTIVDLLYAAANPRIRYGS
ncbi:MAG: hypothetical protein ACXWNK_12430 [Vulcanimicrobiaceae bacterium]